MRIHEKIYVAGHQGLIGGALMRHLAEKRYNNIITRTRAELDLRDQKAVADFFEREKPQFVFMAAGVHGNRDAVAASPTRFLLDNLRIQNNLIHQSYLNDVKMLLFYGCDSIYPQNVPQPIQEDYLLSNPMDKMSEPLGLAKIAGLKMCLEYNRKYGTKNIVAIPIQLFGTGDRFDAPYPNKVALFVREIAKAKKANQDQILFHGTGELMREYLFEDDMAEASIMLMRSYVHFHQPINFGTGRLSSHLEIASLCAEMMGYEGKIEFDGIADDQPIAVGFMRNKIEELSWYPKIGLERGLEQTCRWYLENRG
ncbi:MAG: NAD-dependent epimerase/dehydratase family protein [Deltaproteobacteria bacterium]|nr:NAD-dependent epimerase/dehydratase family protein [Deltaproteobacteria bacterium]